jgi:hypothetical protein
MGEFSNSIKVSDTLILVKEHSEIEVDPQREWGNCKSMNLICIYDRSAGSIIEYYCPMEFFCNDCWK